MTIDTDQDTKGNLWFSTQGKGLFKFHPEKQIWKNYVHNNTPGRGPDGRSGTAARPKESEISAPPAKGSRCG